MPLSRRSALVAASALLLVRPSLASTVADEIPTAGPSMGGGTPLRIGAAQLAVRDLERTGLYYRDVIGLREISRGQGTLLLGAGGNVLLELVHRPLGLPDLPREAGLYHTAFLLPSRAELGRWLRHMSRTDAPVDGASDHLVSEAVYLQDPEGNGVEVYADRSASSWVWKDGQVEMATRTLDLLGILQSIPGDAPPWRGAPEGTRIGHMHLRVGDVGRAVEFYRGAVGLDLVRGRAGAAFLSTGRYHHHLGLNSWQSAGAGQRNADRLGLREFTLQAADAGVLQATAERLRADGVEISERAGGLLVRDPWGTGLFVAPPA